MYYGHYLTIFYHVYTHVGPPILEKIKNPNPAWNVEYYGMIFWSRSQPNPLRNTRLSLEGEAH